MFSYYKLSSYIILRSQGPPHRRCSSAVGGAPFYEIMYNSFQGLGSWLGWKGARWQQSIHNGTMYSCNSCEHRRNGVLK